MTLEFLDYRVEDIGRVFFIYDYKFSGEHCVRLVFDGSRQSPHTYNETYSHTVRAESIRIILPCLFRGDGLGHPPVWRPSSFFAVRN